MHSGTRRLHEMEVGQIGVVADKGMVCDKCFSLVRGWGHGAKISSRFVCFFADVKKYFIFLKKLKSRWLLEDF